MAELNEQKLNQLNARAQEIVTDFARGLGNVFSDLFNNAGGEATIFTENLNQNLSKTKDVTDNIKENQHKINTYLMSSGQIEGQILKLVREREDKVFKIMSKENMGQARKEHHIKKIRDLERLIEQDEKEYQEFLMKLKEDDSNTKHEAQEEEEEQQPLENQEDNDSQVSDISKEFVDGKYIKKDTTFTDNQNENGDI